MPLPLVLADLSTTAASNYPAGSDSPTVLDDVQRAHAAFIAQLRDYFPANPSGMIFDYAGTSAPSGYLLCDGAAVSRATYSALFSKINTTWGVGDGATTFNVPDLRGRTVIGAGTGSGLTARTTGTQNIGAETTTAVAAHTHGFTTNSTNIDHIHFDSGHAHNYFSTTNGGGAGAVVGTSGTGTTTSLGYASLGGMSANANHTHTGTTNSTGSASVENMQPSAVVTKIIKT